MKWFADDHKIAEKKYKITTNARKIEEMILNGQPIPPGYPFITVIESELLGTADGIASINIGGKGADMTHPLENAETSSLGRALAKLGYGLIGSGLASAEEVEEAKHREMTTPLTKKLILKKAQQTVMKTNSKRTWKSSKWPQLSPGKCRLPRGPTSPTA